MADARVTPATDRLRGLRVAFKSAGGSGPAAALEHEWLLLHRLRSGPFPIPVEFRRTARDRAHMTTEWIDGKPLANGHPFGTAEQGYQMIQGALLGLACLHRSGFVHGDVRPQNLLLRTAASGLEVHWTDLEHAHRFGRLASGFAHVGGWNPDAEASGGVQSPRTDLRALGESLRDPLQVPGLGNPRLAKCLRAFIARLCDDYGLRELKDADYARYRLAEAADDATLPPPQPITGPPMLIHNRAAQRQWQALRADWLRDGQTQVLLVEGPRGCGKTAFLRRAAADLAVAGHPVLDWSRSSDALPLANVETALLDDYLGNATQPPVVLLGAPSRAHVNLQLRHHVPQGTWILVETRNDAAAAQASPAPGVAAWSFPPLSKREWHRWVGNSI